MLGQPSVIARLMGMEFEAPTIVPAPAAATAMIRAEDAVDLLKPPSKHKPFKCTSLPHHGRINGDYYRYCLNKMKPRRRSRRSSSTSSSSRGHRHDRHPQEELLEKIKEDFRASWQQASMATEPAAEGGDESAVASASGRRSGDRAGVLDGRLNIQRIAQENLRREKMARYSHGAHKTNVEDEDDGITLQKTKEAEQQQGGSESMVAASEQDSEEFSGAFNGEPEHHGRGTSTPTLIAILRPVGTAGGGTGADDSGEPALGTPPPSWKALRDGRGMDDFLRAVKERLDNEMKAKTGDVHLAPATTTPRRKGWGSEEAKGGTARRIREAAGMAKEDLGRRLSRLESFRVFRGDRGRRDAAAVKSPEHRMLKSVRARIEAMSPKKTGKQGLIGSSSPVSSRGARVWRSPLADASLLSGVGSDEEEEEGGQSCCRGDQQRAMTRLWKVHGATPTADTGVGVFPSPRALVRSFSAPASSAISSGGPETASLSRSRSFSLLRTTVSSGLKQSFSLGGKLLLLMHMSKKKPPSSSSSSPSPVSPLEVQGRGARHFAGDLSCAFLPESSPKRSPKCSSEFEASVIGGESPWRWKNEAAAARADDPDKAYVRELLIAAGLFDDDGAGSSEDTAAATTISYDVFYEVEDAYYYRCLRRRVYGDSAGEEEDDGSPDRRRLLFDLANEALTVMQAGPSSSSPSLRRWVVESASSSSSSRLRSRGSELEDHVWRRVARAIAEDDDDPVPTVDGMVEGEVGGSPWMALREDVCAVGRKVERAIFDDLVSEVMRQVFVRT